MTNGAKLIGKSLSRYKIESQLGAGGMGEVYKAQDTSLERWVALKVLPPQLLESADRVRRFVQEAKAASALNHPNIVTIYEIGQAKLDDGNATDLGDEADKPVHYIAMEYIQGETLRTRIKEESDLRPLLDILAQVAEGLSKAHLAGIVHRDLKPDNVMITPDGFAKVVDFGLAKLTEKSMNENEKTQEGIVMGTIGYMSPEQVQGKTVDQRSDIFSLGCILYEAITRARPFSGDSAIETMHKIVFAPAPPITQYLPSSPAELQRIVGKCLAKDPNERYHSIRDLAVDLRQLKRAMDASPFDMTGIAIPQVSQPPQSGSGPRLQSGALSGPVLSSAPQQRVSASQPVLSTPSGAYVPAAVAAVPVARRRRFTAARITSAIYRTILLLVIASAVYVYFTYPKLSTIASGPVTNLTAERAPATLQPQWADFGGIASSLRKAVVTASDPSFYDDKTFSMAKVQRLLKRETAKGVKFGTSPISRAVAHDVFTSSGVNPLNSLREYAIAVGMEQSLDKKRILEIYLNTVKFGDVYGAKAAAQKYYKKPPAELTAKQSAMLAAMIGAPEGADPASPDATLAGRAEAILETIRGAASDEPKPERKSTKSKKPAAERERSPESTSAEPPVPAEAPTEPAPPPSANETTQ